MKSSPSLFLLLVLAIVILKGFTFAQGNVFVVMRDVPENPSVVVVPAGFTKSELGFADRVEELLLSFKVKVVQRPATRKVTETKGAAKAAGAEVESAVGSQSVTQEYWAYQETGADFLLLTDEDNSRVKLIRIKTGELLGSVVTSSGYEGERSACQKAFANERAEEKGFTHREQYCIFNLLQAAGLPVQIRERAGGK